MLASIALVYTISACLATIQQVHSGPVEDKYSCPHGWTRYGNRKCLKYVNELQDYERAQATCRSKNQGTLVTIHSHEEQNFVYSYIHSIAASSTPIWLGAKQIDFESILWLDKTENSYVNWAPSEPSHPDEICIAINPRTGMWHDVMCTEANVPACERAPTTQWPFFVAFCSEGWFQFNDEKCVRIISSQALNFYESQELCRSKYNSKLLSIKSEKEGEFVHNLIKFRDLKLPVWLGAVQNDFSSFNWIDKSDVTFTNWAEGEPNDPDHACISMTASGGKWSDNDCKEQKLILCQKVPEDGACETGWLQFRQDQCYRFVHIRLTFDDAETLCNNLYGGHLPSIHSQEEQFMIAQFLASVNVRNGSEIWLGGRQMDFHNFNWGDGSLFNYSYWEHGEPNFPAEKCIEMSWRNGRWNDINCRLKRAVLCERQVTSRHLIGKPNLYSCLSADLTANNCNSSMVIGSSPSSSQASSGQAASSVGFSSVASSNSKPNEQQQQQQAPTLVVGPVMQSNGTGGGGGSESVANVANISEQQVVAAAAVGGSSTGGQQPTGGHNSLGNSSNDQVNLMAGQPQLSTVLTGSNGTESSRRINATNGEPAASSLLSPSPTDDHRPIKVITSIINREQQSSLVSSILPSSEQLFSLNGSGTAAATTIMTTTGHPSGQGDQLLANNVSSSPSSSFLSPGQQHKPASIHYNSAPTDEHLLASTTTTTTSANSKLSQQPPTQSMMDTDGFSLTTMAPPPTTTSGSRLSDLINNKQGQQADDAIKQMHKSSAHQTSPEPLTSQTLTTSTTSTSFTSTEFDTNTQQQQQQHSSAGMAAAATAVVNQQPAESQTMVLKSPQNEPANRDNPNHNSVPPKQRPAFVGINRDEHLVVDLNEGSRDTQSNGTTSKSDNDNNNNSDNGTELANHNGSNHASQGVQVALAGV